MVPVLGSRRVRSRRQSTGHLAERQFLANAGKIRSSVLARSKLPAVTLLLLEALSQGVRRRGRTSETLAMHRLRRREARQRYYRPGKIRLAAGARSCDCTVVDISDRGVRLNVEGLDVPDEFVLLISNKGKIEESAYKVVWRFGNELGAKLVSDVDRPRLVERDFVKA